MVYAINASPRKVPPTKVEISLFETILRIRMVEERIATEYEKQEMRCPVHLSIGQEGVAAGICLPLKKDDHVFSGHRNHAHFLAKGGSLNKMIAEIYGKETGCCLGKGGSMHLTDESAGFVAATPIVGSTIPIAVGASLSSVLMKKNNVTVIFFGDGALENGIVHESFNFAKLKNLPIIFVCENNLYSVYSPLEVRQPSKNLGMNLAKAHSLKRQKIDGNNPVSIYEEMSIIVKKIRDYHEPYYIELPTYRWREHCGPNFDNDIGYRTEKEFKYWESKDPLKKLAGLMNSSQIQKITSKIKTEIDEAFSFAQKSKFPAKKVASQHVYKG